MTTYIRKDGTESVYTNKKRLRKRMKGMDNLTRDVLLADQIGESYGVYKGRQHETELRMKGIL